MHHPEPSQNGSSNVIQGGDTLATRCLRGAYCHTAVSLGHPSPRKSPSSCPSGGGEVTCYAPQYQLDHKGGTHRKTMRDLSKRKLARMQRLDMYRLELTSATTRHGLWLVRTDILPDLPSSQAMIIEVNPESRGILGLSDCMPNIRNTVRVGQKFSWHRERQNQVRPSRSTVADSILTTCQVRPQVSPPLHRSISEPNYCRVPGITVESSGTRIIEPYLPYLVHGHFRKSTCVSV